MRSTIEDARSPAATRARQQHRHDEHKLRTQAASAALVTVVGVPALGISGIVDPQVSVIVDSIAACSTVFSVVVGAAALGIGRMVDGLILIIIDSVAALTQTFRVVVWASAVRVVGIVDCVIAVVVDSVVTLRLLAWVGQSLAAWIVQEVCSDAVAGGQAVQRFFTRSMPLQAAGVLTWLMLNALSDKDQTAASVFAWQAGLAATAAVGLKQVNLLFPVALILAAMPSKSAPIP